MTRIGASCAEQEAARHVSFPARRSTRGDALERYLRARRLEGVLPESTLLPIRMRALNDLLDKGAGQ